MQRQKHFLAMLLVSFWLALWASQGIALARGSWAANPAPPEVPVLPSGDSSLPNDPFQGLSPDQVQRAQQLIEADVLYRAGDRTGAQRLYSLAKDPQWLAEPTLDEPILPISDPSQLPPAGQVYWREAQAGADSGVASRVLVPLKLLAEQYPGFLPGQSLYVEALVKEGQLEAAQASLEAAIARFPYQADLLRAQVKVQMAQEHWIEAAITANQFALLNPDHPEAEAMANLARENLDRFRQELNQSLTQNLITNLITGAASYLLTGGLWGGLGALDSGLLLLQGEAALGDQLANQVMAQLPMVEDPEIRAYVNDLGQKLAALTGRQEFDYRFEVIMDDSLNAFALPGGKIFIHAGAIVKSSSEAELAGLLGHEIAHAVLSHGLQMVTRGNLMNSLADLIPIREVAGIAAALVVSGYSRDMERQADVLGTRVLAMADYAADGLHNLMLTLEEEYGNQAITWFASHPNPQERVSYLKQLVDQGGFNRYAYEGVATHLRMRQKMAGLLQDLQPDSPLSQDG